MQKFLGKNKILIPLYQAFAGYSRFLAAGLAARQASRTPRKMQPTRPTASGPLLSLTGLGVHTIDAEFQTGGVVVICSLNFSLCDFLILAGGLKSKDA